MVERSGFGLYVHWPFCQAKCPYCDFNSHVVPAVNQSRWLEALQSEIRRSAIETGPRVLDTIFFGGGTPSLMDPATVAGIIEAARASWTPSNSMEITLEANPTSVEANRFQGFAEAGVNRVSIGVQALNDDDLKALGRLHSVAEAMQAIDIARSAFPRVSFDLIYARQHQSLAAWKSELNSALSMEPDHISLYQLTIEDGTAFGDRLKRDKLPGLPEEDLAADMFEMTQEVTDAAGLSAYEVSNHAAPGQESQHNMIYWRSGDWVGIGPGAHGRMTTDEGRIATETYHAPGQWLKAVQDVGAGENLRETLTDQERTEELLMMGLRLAEGVSSPRIPSFLNNNIKYLADSGLLRVTEGRLQATARGRPLLNSVLRKLLA